MLKRLDWSGSCWRDWTEAGHVENIEAGHAEETTEVDPIQFPRDSSGQCLLLKVEVVVQGPTFFIVFADAEVMPPPFRLDNLTDVSVCPYLCWVLVKH